MNTKKPHIVVIDHFDSFTWNLVVAFENFGAKVEVLRTNTDILEVQATCPSHIVLSPGSGHPQDVRLFQRVLDEWKTRIPILGVCLGHQAIGLHFGASVRRFNESLVVHGKTSKIRHDYTGIFRGVPSPLTVCRYHSLAIIDVKAVESVLRITARSEDGTIMAAESIEYPNVIGVQFHPESLFTEHGSLLLGNFLTMKV